MRRDPNLTFVRDRIRGTPPAERKDLLMLYREAYSGKPVPDDERSQTQRYLELFGLVRMDQSHLRMRNNIYKQVFNDEWITDNLRIANDELMAENRKNANSTANTTNQSVNWTLVASVAVVTIVVVTVVAVVILTRL